MTEGNVLFFQINELTDRLKPLFIQYIENSLRRTSIVQKCHAFCLTGDSNFTHLTITKSKTVAHLHLYCHKEK